MDDRTYLASMQALEENESVRCWFRPGFYGRGLNRFHPLDELTWGTILDRLPPLVAAARHLGRPPRSAIGTVRSVYGFIEPDTFSDFVTSELRNALPDVHLLCNPAERAALTPKNRANLLRGYRRFRDFLHRLAAFGPAPYPLGFTEAGIAGECLQLVDAVVEEIHLETDKELSC